MGIFDVFKSGKARPAEVASGVDKNVAKLGRVAGDKHAQNYDRMEAIEALARTPSAESAAALLRRFTFHIDPSITDQEEKDVAHRGILAVGEAAIEPIRSFCAKAESLSWALKILKEIVPQERYSGELVKLLEPFDTEYSRNNEPKLQLLAELEQSPSAEARGAIERFLDDVSEPVRFTSVAALFAQNDPASAAAIIKILPSEESVRVKNRVAEGLATRGWQVPTDLRDTLRGALPSSFVIDASGIVKKR